MVGCMLGQRLAASRQRAGLKQVELAVALGPRYDQAMISRVESGQKELRFRGAVNAARELNVSLDYLAGLTDEPTPAALLHRDLAVALAKVHELEDAIPLATARTTAVRFKELEKQDHATLEANTRLRGPRTDITRRLNDSIEPSPVYLSDHDAAPALAVSAEPVETPDARCIPAWDVDAAAGDGALFDEEKAIGWLPFRRKWLDRNGLDASECAIITVREESMEPTVPDGAVILINRAQRPRRVGRVYVLRTDDGLVVKRAGKDEHGRWRLLSDNPASVPVDWPDDAEVIGDVKWTARMFVY